MNGAATITDQGEMVYFLPHLLELVCPNCSKKVAYPPIEYRGEYFKCRSCGEIVLWERAFELQGENEKRTLLGSHTIRRIIGIPNNLANIPKQKKVKNRNWFSFILKYIFLPEP